MCRWLPQDTLFADVAIYEYLAHEQLAITAWYVAKEFADAFDVGMDAASRLASRYPGDAEKANNLAWFEKLREGALPASSALLIHDLDITGSCTVFWEAQRRSSPSLAPDTWHGILGRNGAQLIHCSSPCSSLAFRALETSMVGAVGWTSM